MTSKYCHLSINQLLELISEYEHIAEQAEVRKTYDALERYTAELDILYKCLEEKTKGI